MSFLLVDCKKDNGFTTKAFIVAPHRITYTNLFGQTVSGLQVKENPADPFKAFGQEIEGFHYEEGFEFRILVKEYTIANPAADATNLRYVLLRIISKQ